MNEVENKVWEDIVLELRDDAARDVVILKAANHSFPTPETAEALGDALLWQQMVMGVI